MNAPTTPPNRAPSPTTPQQHLSTGMRAGYAILGVAALAFAIALLSSFFLSGYVWTFTLYIFVVVALLVLGISDILSATSHPEAPEGLRTLRLILGVLILIFAFVALADVYFAFLVLWIFVGLGLLFQGLFLLAGVGGSVHLESWQRGMGSALGVLDILLAFLVLLIPLFAFVFVGVLVAFGVVVAGVYLLTMASTGVTKPLPTMMNVPGFPPMGGTGAGPQ